MMKFTNSSVAGGVFASFLASSCCILPFVAGFIGLSAGALGFFRNLEPYRPYFIAMALGFLGYAGYKNFMAKPGCNEDGSCKTDSIVGKGSRSMFWVALFVAIVSISFPWFFELFY